MRTVLLIGALLLAIGGPLSTTAQELPEASETTWRARVVEVVREEERLIPGTSTRTHFQTLRVELLEGPKRGEIITVGNDYAKLGVGDRFFLDYIVTVNGEELYSVGEPDRRLALLGFLLLFIAVVAVFGRGQGVRSLAALGGGIALIFFVLFPQLLDGASPLWTSAGVAAAILTAAIFVTYGINRKSVATLIGTLSAVLITVVLAQIAVASVNMSGFTEEYSVYLNFNTQGRLDFSGLFLAAILIGVLGVLDDIAITQASAVEELHRANPALTRREIYARAIKIGREHVAALINTLALVYVGAALPLLLLLYQSEAPLLVTINREPFTAEIIRMIVGSIGAVLAVPISTVTATLFLVRTNPGAAAASHEPQRSDSDLT